MLVIGDNAVTSGYIAKGIQAAERVVIIARQAQLGITPMEVFSHAAPLLQPSAAARWRSRGKPAITRL